MQNPKVGIVIPMYRVGIYIVDAVRSALKQTYRNIEVVVVNDASPDNSLTLLQRYLTKHPDERVQIVNKPHNEGVDRARFTGIEVCRRGHCEFVTFLDGDDWLNQDLIAKMMEAQKKCDADIVQCNFIRRMGPLKKYSGNIDGGCEVIKSPKLQQDYFISFYGVNILNVNMWGKLFRMELIDEASPAPSGYKMGEDLYFCLTLFPYVKTYCILNYAGYNYRWGGLTSGYNPTLLSDLKDMYHKKLAFGETHGFSGGKRTSIIEMKNVLNSYLKACFAVGKTCDELRVEMNKELNDPCWSDIHIIMNEPLYSEDSFCQAIEAKNPEALVDIAHSRYSADKKRVLVKRFFTPIINGYLKSEKFVKSVYNTLG